MEFDTKLELSPLTDLALENDLDTSQTFELVDRMSDQLQTLVGPSIDLNAIPTPDIGELQLGDKLTLSPDSLMSELGDLPDLDNKLELSDPFNLLKDEPEPTQDPTTPEPETAPETSQSLLQRFGSMLEGPEIIRSGTPEAKMLQELLNELTGSELELDGKIDAFHATANPLVFVSFVVVSGDL